VPLPVCLAQVEGQLVSVYIDAKAASIDDALEEYFFGDGTLWESALPPGGLRDAALELVHALVAVEVTQARRGPWRGCAP
jgi:Exocyst complex component Sec5